MAKKYLDIDGLSHLWQAIKNAFVADVTYNSSTKKIQKTKAGTTSDVVTLATVATSGSYSDLSNKPTIPAAGTGSSYPTMDGTRALGSQAGFARVDHVHPSDTSRVPTTRKVNGNQLNNDITIQAEQVPAADDYAWHFQTEEPSTEDILESLDSIVSLYTAGLCSTAAGTAAKEAAMSNGVDLNLATGSVVFIKFTVTNTAAVANLTLNVDNTGAKPIKYRGGNLPSVGTLTAGRVYPFLYDGTNWELIGDLDTNTTYSDATTSAHGLMTAADKTKLNGIATGAEVNQNAFSNIKVGSTTVAADAKTDTVEFVGSNVTLTPDATNDKVTFGITASNVTTALGNTAVARATADASGNTITSTYAPKASPALSGTPTAPTATAGTNTTQIATTAFVKNAVDTAIVGAAAFQGTAPTSFAPTNYKKGWYWVVGTAGTYAGQVCEVGDMIFCIKDYASAYAAADFDVIQTNLDIISITNAEIDTIVAA